MTPRVQEFDPLGPLPRGISLIEASAGTGKTYAITTLVLRMVAEGHAAIDELLVVTFTRAATAELVGRVRARLALALRALTLPPGEVPGAAGLDAVVRALATASPDERARRADRLRAALRDFDRAAIFTIHGFCQRLLAEHAFETGAAYGLSLVEREEALRGELHRDLLVRELWPDDPARARLIQLALHEPTRSKQGAGGRKGGASAPREPGAKADGGFVKAVLDNPDAPIVPAPAPELDPGLGAALAEFAGRWRGGLRERAARAFATLTKLAPGGAPPLADPLLALDAWLARDHDLAWPLARPDGALWTANGLRAAYPGWDQAGSAVAGPLGEVLEALDALCLLDDALCPALRARAALELRRAHAARLAARRELTYQDMLRGVARRLRLPAEAPGAAGQEAGRSPSRRSARSGGGAPRPGEELEAKRAGETPRRGLPGAAAGPAANGPSALREALVRAVRGRFKAALIDEFQDTDDLQWVIFQALFDHPGAWLFLVGDPKQAIYGFRNANIRVYFAAARRAAHRATLSRSYRADADLVAGLNRLLLRPGVFGLDDEVLGYQRASACERAPARRLRWPGASAPVAPVQLRWLGAAFHGLPPEADGPPTDPWRGTARVARRVADDVVELLARRPRLHDRDAPDADAEGFRAVRPADVAVLVRTARQGLAVQRALRAARVPAVVRDATSVLLTPAGDDVLRWLEALAAPSDDQAARQAAARPLFGWSADALAAVHAGDDPEVLRRWDAFHERLAEGRARLVRHGFLRAFRALLADGGAQARVLAGEPGSNGASASGEGGERRLTDLLHVAELLHAAEGRERLGLAGLLAWLRRERARAESAPDEHRLRLERDDAAVQIVTVHSAKGLEWPIVFLPFLWGATPFGAKGQARLVPADEHGIERVLDVASPEDDAAARHREDVAWWEELREGLRLAYVGLTRPKVHLVVYDAWLGERKVAPLTTILHGDPPSDPDEDVEQDRYGRALQRTLEGDQALRRSLQQLAACAPDCVGFSDAPPPRRLRWAGEATAGPTLGAAPFDRDRLDVAWGQVSFTSLSKRLRAEVPEPPAAVVVTDDPGADGRDHDGQADLGTADPVDAGAADQGGAAPADVGGAAPADGPALEVGSDVGEPALEPAPVLLADFPSGATPGKCVHAALEALDFAALALPASATPGAGAPDAASVALAAQLRRHGLDAARWTGPLRAGLAAAVATPLGGPLGGLCLRDVPASDRLAELAFDLPLAGGRSHGRGEHTAPVPGEAVVGPIAARARTPDGDRAHDAEVFEAVAALDPGALAGYLTGSLDLVFRAPQAGQGRDGELRWFVADYKTNRLHPRGATRGVLACYGPDGMRRALAEHRYALQWHLYLVALHRWLRLRLGAAYDYDRHVGGAYYLFVRGMVGPATPRAGEQVTGVHFDRPPRETIEALDLAFRAAPTRRGP